MTIDKGSNRRPSWVERVSGVGSVPGYFGTDTDTDIFLRDRFPGLVPFFRTNSVPLPELTGTEKGLGTENQFWYRGPTCYQ